MPSTIKVEWLKSIEQQARLEAELEVLNGIINASVNLAAAEVVVEYDDSQISLEKVSGIIHKLAVAEQAETVFAPVANQKPGVRETTYFTQGMHCASCEVLIEKKLLKLQGVQSVEASTSKNMVVVEYHTQRPTVQELNKIFQSDGYTFHNQPVLEEGKKAGKSYFFIAGLIILGFVVINKIGISSGVNINSNSSLPAFCIFGLLAGLSSCAALVGGLILSMSKQWAGLYQKNDSVFVKLQPHLMFNAGRLISYGIFGALLGVVGAKLQVSATFTSILTMIVSVFMLMLALQMLGVKALRRFQITMPRFITRYATDESKFKGRYMPFSMGAMTFFLPCGFTITAQGLALLSGSAWQGGLIMLVFALGTAPILLLIGLSSVKFSSRPHWSATFARAAGLVVLFFALFNINAQFNVLGWSSLNDLSLRPVEGAVSEQTDLPPLVNDQQIVAMNASASGYSPNYIKVRAGVPVRWEITDTGTSGCTNAIISRGLFPDQIQLTPGQVSIKEFTPDKVGKYKFSCRTRMISGVIEVVDPNNLAVAAAAVATTDTDSAIVPSGAKGCGCGGGGGASCGGGAK